MKSKMKPQRLPNIGYTVYSLGMIVWALCGLPLGSFVGWRWTAEAAGPISAGASSLLPLPWFALAAGIWGLCGLLFFTLRDARQAKGGKSVQRSAPGQGFAPNQGPADSSSFAGKSSSGIPAADLVTSVRPAAAFLLFLVLSVSGPGKEMWLLLLLAAAAASDAFDGIIARKYGPTPFGARWDMESDAFFLYALSVGGVLGWGLPVYTALTGLARYGFFIIFQFLPDRSEFPRPFVLYAKSSTAVAMGMLTAAAAPFFGSPMTDLLAVAATGLILLSFLIELVLRLLWPVTYCSGGGKNRSGHEQKRGSCRFLWGLLHSIAVYYWVPGRRRRMRRFYRRLIPEARLLFDIGSHVGNRIRVFRDLGAQVVALEPQPYCRRILESRYGKDPGVKLHFEAVGERKGSADLYVCDQSPTLTTLSAEWIERVSNTEAFAGITWQKADERIQITTLAQLIREYGTPDFVKIDVEGAEMQVLRGLDRPLPRFSFEFLPPDPEVALACLDHIETVGGYQYNLSQTESMKWYWDQWQDGEEVRKFLNGLRGNEPSGDIYAVLKD
ncbi:MAG: FkbM family methyltransferase [Spirochaetales bacterium]|nr:FkbM family methyltransferase [Spirochaetales bacterium]MCF7938045.1 FkbM family methyltransferase [Spirochaetales bacterium]